MVESVKIAEILMVGSVKIAEILMFVVKFIMQFEFDLWSL